LICVTSCGGTDGTADTSVDAAEKGSVSDNTSDDPSDSQKTDADQTISDYGELKITEENGIKILTHGKTKITAKKNSETGDIRGQIASLDGYLDSFTVKGDNHIYSSASMDHYKYIEQMFDIVIDTLTLPDEKYMFTSEPSNLKNVYISETKSLASIDGVIYNANGTTLVYFPSGRTGEYKIKDGTTKIESNAFKASKLTKVYLPMTVTDYKGAFEGMDDIVLDFYTLVASEVDVNINGFRIIGNRDNAGKITGNIFVGGDNRRFEIEEDHLYGDVPVNWIKNLDSAFGIKIKKQTYITDELLPPSIPMTFDYCNIEGYYIEDSDKYVSVDGVIYTGDKKTLVLFPSGRTGEYTIPETVERVCSDAFRLCSLKKLTLPKELPVGVGLAVEVWSAGSEEVEIVYY